jgi:hypothetical protein
MDENCEAKVYTGFFACAQSGISKPKHNPDPESPIRSRPGGTTCPAISIQRRRYIESSAA